MQKQIEILESDDKLGLVHSNYNILKENKSEQFKPPIDVKLNGDVYSSLLKKNFIGPLTVCFRRDLFLKYVDYQYYIDNNYSTIDYSIWLELAVHSHFYYLNDVTATYRILNSSVSNIDHFDKRELFFETSFKTVKNILTKYPTNTISLEESYNGLFYKLLSLAIHYNKFEKAKEYSLKVKPKNYKEFIKCMCAKNYVMFRLLYLVVK